MASGIVWSWLRGAAVALALLLAACGDAAATPTPTPTPLTGAALLPGDFCLEWAALVATHQSFAMPPDGPPPEVRASVESTRELVWALADKTPLEVRDAFQAYATAWSDYAAVMARADYDYTRIVADGELQDALQVASRDMPRGGAKVNAWAQKQCLPALAVTVKIDVAMLGRRAQVFAEGTPERAVQQYLQAVADRDSVAALALFAPALAARCRDTLREAIATRPSEGVSATLESSARPGDRVEVRVNVSESFPAAGSGRTSTSRPLAFVLQQEGARWRLAQAPWPAPCGTAAPAP